MFAVDNPNFSAVLPGPCNAKCSFCTWRASPEEPSLGRFLGAFAMANLLLPKSFRTLSITGGEPTLSPALAGINTLAGDNRWGRVVLTTNGAYLLARLRDGSLSNVTDINLSRHAVSQAENNAVFGCAMLAKPGIKSAVNEARSRNITVGFNTVVTDPSALDISGVNEWVEFAIGLGVTRIAFRLDSNLGMERTILAETQLIESGVRHRSSSGCPVCISRSYFYHGVELLFKYSVNEPSDTMNYELILHQNGVISYDWSAKKQYGYDHLRQKNAPTISALTATCGGHGCGSGGYSRGC